MNKIMSKLKNLIPSKRKLIQLYSALLFNANIKGFFKGSIYQGSTKNLCAPGINCYSCPGAIGACPLGSLQNALGSTPHSAAFYVIGILMLYAILLGRFICGFLCPFGLIQELLYKIKTPKLKKSKVTRILSYLKYVILVYFVVIVPVLYALYSTLGKSVPAFCKYICPAGVVEGAFGYLSHENNAAELSALGPLFTWKFCLLIGIVLGSIFVFRLFCRFLCPLGALYGLFNHFSVFGIKLEKSKCTDCGLCVSKCKVDIRRVNDHECINCGECIDVCPTKAISWKGSQFILPPNEIDAPIVLTEESTEAERALAEAQKAEFEEKQAKIKKRNNILKYVLGGIMIGVLAFALIYYNFIDKPAEPQNDDATLPPTIGTDVGNKAERQELLVFDENGLSETVIDPSGFTGKIAVVYFWNHTNEADINALTALNQLATEYVGKVLVIAIHTSQDFDGAADFVKESYSSSSVIFAKDYSENDVKNVCFTNYGGNEGESLSIVFNEAGVFAFTEKTDASYDTLKVEIEKELFNGNASLPVGDQVGNNCPSFVMDVFDENGLTGGKFDPAKNYGKITIINFWGTWCGGCIEELPYFDQIATEYKDSVTVVAIHTNMQFDTAADYVNTYYKDSDMIFTKDNPIDPDNPYSNEYYFKKLGGGSSYPITIILDEKGVIISKIMKSTTYNELKEIVEGQLNK